MNILLHTEGWFDAAHHLEGYDGCCKNLHGHTYKVELWVRGDDSLLDDCGILFDFGRLKELIKPFDHAGDMTVNLGFNSTAENQCRYLFKQLKKINSSLNYRVRVYEQLQPKKSWAEVGDF